MSTVMQTSVRLGSIRAPSLGLLRSSLLQNDSYLATHRNGGSGGSGHSSDLRSSLKDTTDFDCIRSIYLRYYILITV
jgi:hypothetical protein